MTNCGRCLSRPSRGRKARADEIQAENLGIDYLGRRPLLGAVTVDRAKKLSHGPLDPDGLTFVVVGDPAGLNPNRIGLNSGF
ncbi:MAG: hypothetical protein JO229_09320 [Alphaproteobacteria bacterium]|nr:hypothetical protein [Alphaproteobacteria bacterium]